MKSAIVMSVLAASLAGCVVAPRPVVVAPPPDVVVPAGAVYVGPTYAVPGAGYIWRHHPRFGWGWHHPRAGWHRGWH